MVPTLEPPRKPMPDPMAEATRAGRGPRRIPVTNMTIGARVNVESGGGMGIAVIVVTAIKAAITDVAASMKVALGLAGFASDAELPLRTLHIRGVKPFRTSATVLATASLDILIGTFVFCPSASIIWVRFKGSTARLLAVLSAEFGSAPLFLSRSVSTI